MSDKKSGQTNDWLSELYTRIGRFQTQDILRIDNKEVADKSRPKLYAMGIRSQAQLDKILADDESKELASRIFNTMKIPGGGDLSTILGD